MALALARLTMGSEVLRQDLALPPIGAMIYPRESGFRTGKDKFTAIRRILMETLLAGSIG